MTKLSGPFVGIWRFFDLGGFEPDYVDMLGPGHLSIDSIGTGHFEFGVVTATLDLRLVERDGVAGVEFSWDGFDEDHPVNGRGIATVSDDDVLEGVLYFHLGDDYAFKARRTMPELLRSQQAAPPRLRVKRGQKSRRR